MLRHDENLGSNPEPHAWYPFGHVTADSLLVYADLDVSTGDAPS